MNKKLYVNTLQISDYINPNHNISIAEVHKINFKEFISGMLDNKLIKVIDDKYAENDPYLVPIYILIPLVSRWADVVYFVDEYFSSGENKISFLGDIVSSEFMDTSISHINADEFTMFCDNFMLSQIERKFSRAADLQYSLAFQMSTKDSLSRYIDIDKNTKLEISHYQYLLGTGLIFYTNPVIVNTPSDKLVQLSYLNYRSLKLRKDRDRWDIDNLRRELKPDDAEVDCRLNDFDIISSMFDLILFTFGSQNSL